MSSAVGVSKTMLAIFEEGWLRNHVESPVYGPALG
jgi:hypothetical protein